jgi:hypothetical protein
MALIFEELPFRHTNWLSIEVDLLESSSFIDLRFLPFGSAT